MVNYNPLQNLPSSHELPDSDDTPVDSELQILVPTLLRGILDWLWGDRNDWFFGVNMGLYHTTGKNPRIPIVPDGFLSLGVERRKEPHGRKSYVVWEEKGIVPIFVLEFVSQTYGGEYDEKIADYARLGVLYYAIYNPQFHQRDKHEPFEVYRLVNGIYQRHAPSFSPNQRDEEGLDFDSQEPIWLPEIGLGIGREMGTYENWEREWLYWYDREGKRLSAPDEVARRLAARLRAMGIDPEAV